MFLWLSVAKKLRGPKRERTPSQRRQAKYWKIALWAYTLVYVSAVVWYTGDYMYRSVWVGRPPPDIPWYYELLIEILFALFAPDITLLWDKHGRTPLMRAASRGRIKTARALVAGSADVNANDKYGTTVLIAAAEKGRVCIVNTLLDAGADPDKKDNDGGTALIEATRNGHADVVKALLEGGADMTARDAYNKTALMYAVEHGRADIVRLLKQAGAKE